MSHIFQEAVGVLIVVTMGDVSGASNTKLYYRKPSGATGHWEATLASSTTLEYFTVAGDLNEYGVYQIQPYMEIGTWLGRGDIVSFTIAESL